MFKYSKKQIIIASAVLAVLLIVAIVLISTHRSRATDLALVSQANILAVALENYYDHFNVYPVSQEVNLQQVKLLTDQGFNQPGEMVYYQQPQPWPRTATFLSSQANYVIKFSLKNSWSVWQLSSWRGGDCRLTNNVIITCENKQ